MLGFRNWFRKRFRPKFRLAFTAAAEHYTASLAFLFVHVRPELITNSASPFREILLYHSIEELEHKAVCFDLFKHYSGNYLTYLLGFVYLSFDLFRKISKRFRYLLSKDHKWDKAHRKMLRKFLLGKGGLIRLSIKRILSYIRPGFHPWENDDRGNIRKKFSAIMETSGIQDFKMA
jgi:predicted metal-dependent hydrolase